MTFFTITAGPGTAVMTCSALAPVSRTSLRMASTTWPSSWMTFDWMTVGGSAAKPSAVRRGPLAPCCTSASLTLLEPMSRTRKPLWRRNGFLSFAARIRLTNG